MADLVEEHNLKNKFADKLKDAALMFDWDRDMLEGETSSRYWREQPRVLDKGTGKEITFGLVLQLFGTDCMRMGFYDGVWVSFVKKTIQENPQNNYVIPDVRFENEAEIIKALGGNVWCVKRGPDPLWFRQYVDLDIEPTDVHRSEWAWAKTSFEHSIYNEGTIDELKSQVRGRLASTLRLASAKSAGNSHK